MARRGYLGFVAIGFFILILSSGTIFAYASDGYQGSHNPHTTTTNSHSHDQSTTTTTTTYANNGDGNSQDHSHSTTTTTTTYSTTTTSTQNQNKESHELKYRMSGTGAFTGQGEANIQIQGTFLNVNIEIEHASDITTYSVVLVAIATPGSGGTSFGTSGFGTSGVGTTTTSQNVCTSSIGQLMTSKVGQGIAHLDTTLPAGTYQIGVVLCVGSTPAIMSVPTTQQGIITSGQGNDNESNMHHHEQHVNLINPGTSGQDQIQNAEQHGYLFAAIGHENGHWLQGSSVNSDLSASVGIFGSNGMIVSMSSQSSYGPGAVLVDLGSVSPASVLQGMAVTFDGVFATPVSSISQVLNSPAGQSNYVILQTATGLELLMSVPHVTDDVIQILPAVAYNWIFISMAAFASIAVVGVAVVFYRKSYFPFATSSVFS